MTPQSIVDRDQNKTGLLVLAGVALSTSNLLLLPVWSDILYLNPISQYYMLGPTVACDYFAAIADLLLVAAVIFAVGLLIARTQNRYVRAAAEYVFLALLVIPLNTFRLSTPYQLGIGIWMARAHQKGLFIPLVVGLCILAAIMIYLRRYVFNFARIVVLLLLPYALITSGQAVAKAIHGSDTAPFGKNRLFSPLVVQSPQPAVVWIIFDEMDESMAFSRRPAGLSLPAFDALRKEAIFLSHAMAPSVETLISLPSLLTGVHLEDAKPGGISELTIYPNYSTPEPLTKLPNVFMRVKAGGFRTTVAGWYHPYCRLFSAALDQCSWRPVYQSVTGQVSFEDKNFFKSMSDELRAISPLNRRRLHIDAYNRILADAKQAATQPSGLIFLHFPIPHAPVIYNRKTQQLTTLMPSNITGYVDNLALCDRTLAELRNVMEQHGTWKSTTLIISSDHPWRDAANYEGKKYPYVPFLVKMPEQSGGIEISSDFHTIHTQELVLAVLQGKIHNATDAAEWIKAQK
ncbi:MAG: hypothetical protein C5B54_09495 [Acidobacteria bacterium]|nr:MAG: hypothetical protein C5B54_09495 [Acidobacteriota bacterium]